MSRPIINKQPNGSKFAKLGKLDAERIAQKEFEQQQDLQQEHAKETAKTLMEQADKETTMRLNIKKVNGSRFGELIHERIELTKALRAADTNEALKLTATAAVARAIKIAGTTPERLKKLREKLDAPEMANVAVSLRRMVAAFRTLNWGGPSAELRRLGYLIDAETLAELAGMQSSTFELQAVGWSITAEKFPDAFGTCTDHRMHQQKLLDMRLQLDELDAAIAEGYTAADLIIDDKGMAYFALSGGKVPVGPKHNAGERLINFLIARESKVMS